MSDPQADTPSDERCEALLEAQAYQRQLAEERDRLRLLLEINNAVISQLDSRSLYQQIAASLRRVLRQDYWASGFTRKRSRQYAFTHWISRRVKG
jgi:hypothetical protein